MKFSASFAALSALASSMLASAAPLRARQVVQSASFTNGAAYFISNEPSGNYIVAADIASDGRLFISKAYATGGRGQHGDDGGPVGADPLFSQGAIKANIQAGLIAAANPGSNSVSLFKINPDQPTELTLFGMPISSGGEFPMSVAFNDAGDRLCVLNGGAINGVQCFTMDPDFGLMPASNSMRSLGMNQTTPPLGPGGTASQIIFSEDQKSVIVAVKGTSKDVPGFLATWDMNDDGSLSSTFTRIEVPEGGAAPFSLTPIPGRNGILSADFQVGVDIFDFSNGAAMVTASNKTVSMPIANQSAVCWSAWSPKTDSFYVTDTVNGIISELAVSDDLTPSLLTQYTFPQFTQVLDLEVASLPDNDFLYTLMPGAMSVQVMSLNAPGQAQAMQTLDLSAPAQAIGLPINGTNVSGMTVYVKPQVQ
ncbi:hypothetical protein OF83DRAFT_1177136 [Amylostereum chailletii]|nr:hypothetical protein OF83DRAFT_1177136 [Amylostereum chailletii]